jgi:DNA processing protein
VDVASPAGHAGLYREIAASGAVVSEFAPGDAARTWHFLRRNRVISGLALGTIVVEAGAKSGALITARHATEQDREVFAVPGSPLRETSAGPSAVLRDGAALVRGWEDVLSELEPGIRDTWPAWSGRGPSDLFGEPVAAGGRGDGRRNRGDGRIAGASGAAGAGDRALERILLAALGRGPLHVDELCAAAGGDIAAVLAVLSALELDGVVRQLPGKRFARP